MKRSGGTFITAELAQDYGITDIDGKVIPSLRAERGSPIWRPVSKAAWTLNALPGSSVWRTARTSSIA